MATTVYGPNNLSCSDAEWQVRTDLSAAYHLASLQGFNEASTNDFTATVPGEPGRYLVFSFGSAWDETTASSLLKVDKDGNVINGKGKCDTAGFVINRFLHEGRSRATAAVLHTHQTSSSALATLASEQFPKLHATNSYFQDEIVIDDECNGQYDAEVEGKRLSGLIGSSRVLVQRDHGPYVAAESVAMAWWYLYHLEKIANVAVAALGTGKQLHAAAQQEMQMGNEIRTKELAEANFEAAKRSLLKGPHSHFLL
ncbi:hypothetical protein WJX74_009261 [Apatococcus lobatus]|uniref:Class II aldolase/adducin N-terminal domain-containing protein n=1 Tax=Apatococcus lobatus TaxID=904363 RepID=A0AAW1SB99_9CHLO